MLENKRNKNKGYFGERAFKYDEIRFKSNFGKLFHSLEINQLKKVIPRLEKGALICEVGCGTARFSNYLAKKGFNVFATDPSVDMIRMAKEKCSGIKNIKFYTLEGASLNFKDEKFDFVFAIRVLNQTESENYAKDTVREMIRITKPGGLILIEFVNKFKLFKRFRSKKGTHLSFGELIKISKQNNCNILNKSGILIFSESSLSITPQKLLPIYKLVDRLFSILFRKYTTRGYILLRKNNNN